jgi:dCTP deaminase
MTSGSASISGKGRDVILTGAEIRSRIGCGDIVCEPFFDDHVNPNSIDLTLGDKILRYSGEPLDPMVEAKVEEVAVPAEGLLLPAGSFCLGCSAEKIGSNHFVPLLHAKSSTARAGLFVHLTADLIDIGSIGRITFQFYATLPFTLRRGMRIAQMTFWKPMGEIALYDGKYQHSEGPRKSLIFRDQSWSKLQ